MSENKNKEKLKKELQETIYDIASKLGNKLSELETKFRETGIEDVRMEKKLNSLKEMLSKVYNYADKIKIKE